MSVVLYLQTGICYSTIKKIKDNSEFTVYDSLFWNNPIPAGKHADLLPTFQ